MALRIYTHIYKYICIKIYTNIMAGKKIFTSAYIIWHIKITLFPHCTYMLLQHYVDHTKIIISKILILKNISKLHSTILALTKNVSSRSSQTCSSVKDCIKLLRRKLHMNYTY